MKKLLLVSLLFLFPSFLWAEIPDEVAIRCIMGEARGEPYLGQVAVGEVLRVRGSVKGVYGCNARFKPLERELKTASKAWVESAHSDLTKSATHFENVEAFGTPKWAKLMQKTVKIGQHTFFK